MTQRTKQTVLPRMGMLTQMVKQVHTAGMSTTMIPELSRPPKNFPTDMGNLLRADFGGPSLVLTDRKSLLALRRVGPESEAESERFHGRRLTKVGPGSQTRTPEGRGR